MRGRRLIKYAVAILALVVAATATAYWTTSGSGSASATAATLNAPTNVSGTANQSTVSVSWTGSTLSNGTPAQGYYVTRTNTSTSVTSAACGSSSSSLISGTSCSDTNVPNATYTYKVTAVYHTWTAVSAASTPVTVAADLTAPSITTTFPTEGGVYKSSGWTAGCSPNTGICGTASDSGGVASVEVSILRQSTNKYWDGSGFNDTSENFRTAIGTTSWRYDLALPPDGDYTVHVRATDGFGNTTTAGSYVVRHFTIDTTAPAVSVTKVNGSTVTFPYTLNQDVTSIGGTCGSATGDLSPVSWSFGARSGTATCSAGSWSSGTFTAITAESTYTAQASQSDSVGNTGSDSKSVTIDKTAPTLSTLQMFDNDHNGKVDQVKATFNESLNTSYSAPNTVWTLANAPGGAGNTIATSGVSVSGSVATLTLNEGTVNTAPGVYSGTTLSSFTIALATNANGIRDAAGNTSSFAATAVADKANPIPTGLTFSGGNNTPSQGDTISTVFSEPLAVSTMCSTWSGNTSDQASLNSNGAPVTFRIVNNGAASSNDQFTVQSITGGNCATFSFGTVDLGSQAYVVANQDISGTGSNASKILWTFGTATLRLTLGNLSGTSAVNSSPTATYTPGASITDIAGNAVTGTTSHTGNHF
jgi:hypothetical protein